MTRGDIWWVDLGIPFGSEPGFRRPVIIIQDDSFNDSNINTIIVVPLTTNLHLSEAPGNFLLTKKETALPKDSVVNISQLATIDRERFLKKVSNLKAKHLIKINEGIRLILSLD
jgi:mRNA interferase MazF